MKPLKLPKWKWDSWQQEILEYSGNILLRAGRQTGKSEVISEKAFRFATDNPGTTTLIIAASDRQANLLYEKTRAKIDIKDLKEKPTLHKLLLKNGSVILSYPAGRTGNYVRGLTVDLLIADEAPLIPEMVWTSVTPMLAVSKTQRGFGWIFMLGTPLGKGGKFYETSKDTRYKQWHISAEKCMRIDSGWLANERRKMTKNEYKQEYLAEFIDDWNQLFPTDLIKKCQTSSNACTLRRVSTMLTLSVSITLTILIFVLISSAITKALVSPPYLATSNPK